MKVLYTADGTVNSAMGAIGGGRGGPARAQKRERDGSLTPLPACYGVTLEPGEFVVSHSAGGGGYGHPFEREPERVLHDLGRGAVIGEIALLSDRMRSATVRAVRDSDLFLLRTASFKALIEQNPGFLAQMARLLIERLLAVDRPQPDAGNRAIAVAPAGRDPAHAKAIAAALADQLTGKGTTVLLDRAAVDRQLGPEAAER